MKKWMLLLVFTLALAWNGTGQVLDTASVMKQVDSLIQISRALTAEREFGKALEVNAAAEKLALDSLGRETAAYGSCCFNRGRVFHNKFDYPEAEIWFLESKNIREKVLGKEHPDYAKSLNSLGVLYTDNMPQFEIAERFYLEALAIRAKMPPCKEHSDYTMTLNNLGALYVKTANYEEAEGYFLETMAIRERVLPKEHPDYALSLENLGVLYYLMGDYEKAEPLLLEALGIKEKAVGRESLDYAWNMTNLAVLYMKMGNFEKAEGLLHEAIAITGELVGKEHPDYAWSLENLAVLYLKMKKMEQSEPLLLQALDIRKKVAGGKSLEYVLSLHYLANFNLGIGNYQKAEPLFLKVIDIRKKLVGEKHPDYAMGLHNLAVCYAEMRNFEKAESLFLEAKAIREKILTKDHPDYALSLTNLARLYDEMGDKKKAEAYYKEHSKVIQSLISKARHHLSERELSEYILTFSESQAQLLSFAQRNIANKSSILQACYDEALFYKGFLLNAVIQIKIFVLLDSANTEKFNRLKSYERCLAREYSKPLAERDHANMVVLETTSNDLEKKLGQSVTGYAEAGRQAVWQEVQQVLKADEAAIEFIHFQYYSPTPTDSTFYAALLLRPGWEQPRFVPLFEQKNWEQSFDCPGLDPAECASLRYSQKNPSQLYQLLWQPLDSLLAGVSTVYFAPSGQLHLLDFDAINTGNGKTLSDRYRLVRLGSTRQLASSESGIRNLESNYTADADSAFRIPNSAFLFGGTRYEMDSTAIAAANSQLDVASTGRFRGVRIPPRVADSTLLVGEWEFLPGTKTEVENILPILQKQDIAVHTFDGFGATEEAFKSIGSSAQPPRILHLATHGFFFPDPKAALRSEKVRSEMSEPVFKISDHPMIRSGLVMAGANHAWQHGKPLREGMEDGILTAYEISQTNLRGTELVVLSACQTGLGDLHTNEGVYGLQRAFKIAGARYLVMSLQPVPDEATQEFMTMLYQKWLAQNLPLPDAFRAAQSAMRKKYPDEPLNWSGWVLVE